MHGFVFRLLPPRPTFTSDMTDDELSGMREHGAHWRDLMAKGSVLAFGPVADPAGVYGLGVVPADDLAGAEAFRDGDPAVQKIGMRTGTAPMVQLVTPVGEYS